jgi:hypothetical protein
MYVNKKKIPLETIPGVGEEGMEEIGGGGQVWNSSLRYLKHCKNFYKWFNVPPPSIKNKEKENIDKGG